MQIGLAIYRLLTSLLSPLAGPVFRARVKLGKEAPSHFNERQARHLPQHCRHNRLLWLHAASVGESLIQLDLVRRLSAKGHADLAFLVTCQTQTAATCIQARIGADPVLKKQNIIQQMAPFDTPAGARRFLSHWQPKAAIFTEGDVWPNLVTGLKHRNIPIALINARMTEKSFKRWQRWPGTAQHLFGSFACILAGSRAAQTRLMTLSKTSVACPGNLKHALAPPDADPDKLAAWKTALSGRNILLAASTHDPEEQGLIAAWKTMPGRPFLILAPRHPQRGDAIMAMLGTAGLKATRHSCTRNTPESGQDIVLADTTGEMGLWYRLADTVYLGGGHAPGIGGHNPLEALRLGKPVITGPDLFNFTDIATDLSGNDGFTIINTIGELPARLPALPPTQTLLNRLEESAHIPMQITLDCLFPLLRKADLVI